MKEYKEKFQIHHIMERLHYIRLFDESQQHLLHTILETIIEKIPNLKLIVIDSFAAHLRNSDLGY